MRPTINFKWSSDVLVTAGVATAGRFFYRVRIDRVGDLQKDDVPGDNPSDHKDAKGNVAGDLELEVFEYLSGLVATKCQQLTKGVEV